MKIIKPLRLSVLHRPFRFQGKNHLGVSVIALLDMGPTPQLRPEVELWQLAAAELQASGGVIDLAMPKARAEFLATGHAYTHHQTDKTACAVRIDVDRLSKRLTVYGDRVWSGSQPTQPRKFDAMRLDWSRAFGGAGHEENPHGIGASEEQHDGATYRRLPNIESAQARMTSPRQQPEPVSFGPLDINWPRRSKRLGRAYDAHWLQHDFPGLARDADWRVFNAASPDQWWPEQDALPPEAAWRIWNMHPSKPLQSGTLPPWQARCFIHRQRGEETLFEEMTLRATTLWFFPHLEQMMLIWQGSQRINQDDAADVLQLMPALEKTGASRSLNHYRKVLTQRLDKEKGALFAFREQDLLPAETIGPWIDSEVQQHNSPMQDNMQRRVSRLRELHRARLEDSGSDSDIDGLLAQCPAPPMPTLDELPEFVEALERQADELQAQAAARKAEMETRRGVRPDDGPRGPESMYRMQELLYQHADSMTEKKLTQSRESLHRMYLMAVQHQPPALRMAGDMAQIMRQRAQTTQAQGGDFSGLDFTGADFSGMDFRGANFRRALLENANLSGCRLDGADFSDAMLARADLRHSSLRGCNLQQASLALAQCQQTDFSGADLSEAQLDNALFEQCDFSDAIFKTLMLRQVGFSHCRFQRATLEGCVFIGLTLLQPDFSAAKLHKTVFQHCDLQAALFNDARLESCNWVASALPQAQFNGATLLTCAVVMDSDLSGANFGNATLIESNLRQASLAGADFSLAKLENSDLSEANCQRARFIRANLVGSLFIRTDFRQANFTNANLMGALLQKTQLGGADFSGANLFRADLSQSSTSMTTRLDNAYTQRVKTLPKHDGERI